MVTYRPGSESETCNWLETGQPIHFDSKSVRVWYGRCLWRPGPASDRDIVTSETLRAGIRAPPPEKPYFTHRAMGKHGTDMAEPIRVWYGRYGRGLESNHIR